MISKIHQKKSQNHQINNLLIRDSQKNSPNVKFNQKNKQRPFKSIQLFLQNNRNNNKNLSKNRAEIHSLTFLDRQSR
jgi:hypothetical protein